MSMGDWDRVMAEVGRELAPSKLSFQFTTGRPDLDRPTVLGRLS
jgi:hypothetical protein